MSTLLKTLERINEAQQASVQKMGQRQEENMMMQLVKTLIRKVEMAKGDKGDKPVAGIDFPIPKDGKDGYTPRKGIDYFDGESGRDGVNGTNGKDGQDADLKEVRQMVTKEGKEMKKEADKALKEHVKEHNHKLLHDSKMLGKLELNEESLTEGAILQIQGDKLVAVDMPKLQQTGTWRSGGSSVTDFYRINTVSESESVQPEWRITHIDATSGNIVLTLHSAEGHERKSHVFKRGDNSSNTVTIATQGSETIDGDSTYLMPKQYMSMTVYSDGVSWFIV